MLLKLKSTLLAFQRWDHSEKSVSTWNLPGMPAAETAHAVPAEETIPRSDADRSALDEEHTLIQSVFLQPTATRRQMVLFAEVDRHPGGAAACARIAEVLAQGGGKVCIADADVRAPSLHERFHVQVTHGWLDALEQGGAARDAVQQVGSNLWLLASGSHTTPSRIVLAADRLRQLFKDLRDEFDYVLVNGPPFSQHAESMLLSQLSDGVVLIVEAHKTRRERARAVTESLAAAKVPLFGVLLNNRTFPIPDAIYHRL
jgi:Mrp family chromosome partitioning ATPase